MSSKVVTIDWEAVQNGCHIIAKSLEKEYKGIVAITRGGMIPACLLSKILEIKYIENFCITSYEDKKQGDIKVIKEPKQAICDAGSGWLVVDDLTDTGVTLKTVMEKMPLADVATIYVKPAGASLVDYYAYECGQTIWIQFPWE